MRPEDKAQLEREHELLREYVAEWAPTLKDEDLRTLRAEHSDLKALKAQLLDAFADADKCLNSITIGIVVVDRMMDMLEDEIFSRKE